MGVNGNFTIPRGLQHTTSRLFQTHWVSSHLYWLRWNLVDRLIVKRQHFLHKWSHVNLPGLWLCPLCPGNWAPRSVNAYISSKNVVSKSAKYEQLTEPPNQPWNSWAEQRRCRKGYKCRACGVRFCCRHGESSQVTHSDNNTTIIESHTQIYIYIIYIYINIIWNISEQTTCGCALRRMRWAQKPWRLSLSTKPGGQTCGKVALYCDRAPMVTHIHPQISIPWNGLLCLQRSNTDHHEIQYDSICTNVLVMPAERRLAYCTSQYMDVWNILSSSQSMMKLCN